MSSKREFWFRHIETWRKGRLAHSEYARKHNLSIKSFVYYRRRYFKEQELAASQTVKTNLLPITVIPETVTTATSAAPEVENSGITLISPGDLRIALASGFDPQTLQQVLKILEAA